MGDCIISLSAIKYLKELGNFSEIHFGVAPRHASLFKKSLSSDVMTFGADYRSFKGIISFFKKISEINPDYIIEFSPVRRTGKVIHSHKVLTRAKYQYFSSKIDTISWPDDLTSTSCLNSDLNDIWCAFGADHDLPSVAQYLPPTLESSVLNSRPFIAMSMASSSEDHMPSVKHFLELVDSVANRFPDKEIVIPTSNSALDQKIKTQLMQSKHELNFIESGLEELPDLFNQCCFFVGMDTGIKHLAAYLGLPTFSYIPEKSYPYSHPYLSPHKAVLLHSDPLYVKSAFWDWLDLIEQ
ncbi:hypothetical protein LRP49_23345 [Enterovibrio sp. ZSDZ35]|uniref:ADP-heptose:LPS heptosyltransferase n=1 Tax=Enterovibrio qingdaonensis TaxID=2899818 RepID=A0ABT5QT81_9GAMM|nr:glycosyltransferase family 9 protein [Enterovibrio sp. ZSDZ35]MDD1784114.1 hypothetical protein [Enterovibrio sp. ZSDZ35]